ALQDALVDHHEWFANRRPVGIETGDLLDLALPLRAAIGVVLDYRLLPDFDAAGPFLDDFCSDDARDVRSEEESRRGRTGAEHFAGIHRDLQHHAVAGGFQFAFGKAVLRFLELL